MLAEWAHVGTSYPAPHPALGSPGHCPARLDTARLCSDPSHPLSLQPPALGAHPIPSLSPPVPGDSTGRRQWHGDTTVGTVPLGQHVPCCHCGSAGCRVTLNPISVLSLWALGTAGAGRGSRMGSRAAGAASPARSKAPGTDLGIPRAASARPALVLPSPARSCCCSAMSHRWKTNSI